MSSVKIFHRRGGRSYLSSLVKTDCTHSRSIVKR